ncbi:MAG: 50S ribosomal protein L9 [Bacteroidetes bacterium]|nr:50S ribosomal protein L9 [Bacteroidota bacterium]MBS1748200.1 50S ribosomal protein L9 [Bacteroidota bacterium]
MEVILIKDVDNLGGVNELVSVRPGYARNYLIPQKFALEANESNKKMLAERQKVSQKREAKLMAEIAKVTEVLKQSPVKVGAKTGTSGKIFGSVTAIQIARAIREQKGYEIDRRRISITEEVKELGLHKASIDFGKEHVVEIEFEVVGE